MTFYNAALRQELDFKDHPTFRRLSPAFSSTTPRFKAQQVNDVGFYTPTGFELSNNSKRASQAAFRSTTPKGISVLGNQLPGIGEYDPKGPAWGKPGVGPISRSQRFPDQYNSNPAPGDYAPAVDYKGRSIASRGRGPRLNTTSQRFKGTLDGIPAPGAYDASTDRKGRRISASHRGATLKTTTPRFQDPLSDTPAPGAYDENPRHRTKGPNLKSSTVRFKTHLEQSPAPGAYSVNTSSFVKHGYVTGKLRK